MPSESAPFAEDATDGGLTEMGRKDQRVRFGRVVHRPAARLPGSVWELAECGIPVWPHELQWMVHYVAPEQRSITLGIKTDAGVVDTVTGTREK